jgi:acetyl-CoA carboxylase carboxyltransferase component
MANNPGHLGGAIDADAADKAARFMQLCNAHGIAIVSLVDTPGFMVGPEIEKTAQVRHVSRLFVMAAKLRVPYFSVVLRKGYGLGAMGMTAGSFHAPIFTVAWPTGEFGAMGLEGAVRLGFRKELEALPEGASARRCSRSCWPSNTRMARPCTWRPRWSRCRHRPCGDPRLAGARPGRCAPARCAGRFVDTW